MACAQQKAMDIARELGGRPKEKKNSKLGDTFMFRWEGVRLSDSKVTPRAHPRSTSSHPKTDSKMTQPCPSFPWLILSKEFPCLKLEFSEFFSVFSKAFVGSVGAENPW